MMLIIRNKVYEVLDTNDLSVYTITKPKTQNSRNIEFLRRSNYRCVSDGDRRLAGEESDEESGRREKKFC